MEAEGINPYPHKFHVDMRLPDYCEEYESKIPPGEKMDDAVVSIAGRIASVRGQGKLFFYDLRGDGAKVQVMSDLKMYQEGEEAFYKIHRIVKRGDIIGVKGVPGKSKRESFLYSLVRFSCSVRVFICCHRKREMQMLLRIRKQGIGRGILT
jgi:Lysyl-tRNA synthetase (class II)